MRTLREIPCRMNCGSTETERTRKKIESEVKQREKEQIVEIEEEINGTRS